MNHYEIDKKTFLGIIEESVAWKSSIKSHILLGRVPITPKISQILFGNKINTAFHVSDILHLNNIKNVIGTNRAISCFTYMDKYYVENTKGIQTLGGILYEMRGHLLFPNTDDSMSRPDENGIRWVDDYNIIGWSNLKNKWYDINYKLASKNSSIKDYFNSFEKFVIDNRNDIMKVIRDKSESSAGTDWDEILLSNVVINDVYFNTKSVRRIYEALRHNIQKNYKELSQNQRNFMQLAPSDWIENTKQKTIQTLSKISNGKVYTENDITPQKFILDRGGFTEYDTPYTTKFKKNLPHSHI